MTEPDQRTADRGLRQRANRILAVALDLDGGERQALIDRECGSDGPLRELVLRLLALCEEPDDLEQKVEASLATVQADLERRALGTDQVGPYRLVRELGRGGMGVVYLARRDDGLYEHDVAVKVLHPGSAEQVGHRFAKERQILAALDHSSIARLLDAGSTPNGIPYLVMERVEGLPIDRFCAECRQPISQRLELFCQVCEAVEAAHRSLVIHRDLKPSNVLVTADGKPKLLDFGIAKLLEEDSAAAHHTTVRMLTLEWASPEQLLGKPQTVQSDVYQLGLLLHHLLTGRLPYSLTGLSPGEREAVICDRELPTPSSAVRDLPAVERTALAHQLGLGPSRVAAALVGDLDAIVLQALRKEPRQRYESVERLRRDIERSLHRQPVSARLPTLRYRASRFLQRHRLAVLASAVALVAFVALGTFSVLRIAAERDHARREAARAEQREQEARAATDFLAELLSRANPHQRGQVEELTVRQALDLGLEQLETKLRDAPQVRARVLHVLAEVFQTLGDLQRSIELGNEAIALWESAGPAARSDLAAALESVGDAHQTAAEEELARRNFERALKILRQLHPEGHPRISALLSDLAIYHDEAADHVTAGRLFEEALAILDKVDDEAFPGQKALLLSNFGIFNKNLAVDHGVPGAFEKSETALRRSLEELESRTELRSRVPVTYVNLGNLQFEMGRLEESEVSLRQALAGIIDWFGPDHPQVALAQSNLGRTLMALGRLDEADTVLRSALAIRESAFGPDHPRVGVVVQRLGNLRFVQQRPVDALPLLQRALAVRRKALGDEHPKVGDSLRDLARCHAKLGEVAQASELYRQAIEVYVTAGRGAEAVALREQLAGLRGEPAGGAQ
ncbi:MAG: serine/threonine-protein kinase [Acidobacteriota bacterium]